MLMCIRIWYVTVVYWVLCVYVCIILYVLRILWYYIVCMYHVFSKFIFKLHKMIRVPSIFKMGVYIHGFVVCAK